MKAGTLEIDLIANVARLSADMAQIKKAVGSAMTSVTADAISADAAISRIGTNAMPKVAGGSRLAAHHAQNLAFQLNDVVVSLVSGQKPMTVFFQQGSQIGQIMGQAGLGVGGFVKALFSMVGIIKVAGDAELTAAAAASAAVGKTVAAELQRAESAATAATAEIALAEASLAATAGTDAEAAALARLGAAQKALGTSTAEAAVASEALSAVNVEVATTAEAAAAAESVALAPLGLILAALAIVAGGAALAIHGLQSEANKGDDMKKYAESIGVSTKEMRHMKDVTVTFGDTAKAVFQVIGKGIWDNVGGGVSAVWDVMKDWGAWIGSKMKAIINFMIGSWVGGFNGIKAIWSTFPAVLGDLFYSAVNLAIKAINWLVEKHVDALNGFAHLANKVLPTAWQIPDLKAPKFDLVQNAYAGAGKKAAGAYLGEVKKAMGRDYLGEFGSAIVDQARRNARDRIRKAAEQKGYLDPKKDKSKTDKHAEELAREAAAMEAAIKGLWALADAYKVSDEAALKAAAIAKATEQAIKKQGDVEAFVSRELRKEIAQRAADAGRQTGDLYAQARAQEAVNNAVAAGTLAQADAADALAKLTAVRPLIAAANLAKEMGDSEAYAKLMKDIDDLTGAMDRNNRARDQAKALAATATTNDDIEMMKLELSLITATNAERAVAIARLKAEQDVRNNMRGADPATQAAYIQSKVDEAKLAAEITAQTTQFNEQLQLTAELADDAGNAIANAFGKGGEALGEMIHILGNYAKQQKEIDDQVKNHTKTEAEGRAMSTSLQLSSYGELAGAAKSLFKEHSAGYEAMAAAEKAFAVLQAINTVKSLAAGAAKMFATLGPWAFPAVAAMVAVMAGFGFSGGGGGAAHPEWSAEEMQKAQGAGSVLGDATAKSASIGRALDIMAKNSSDLLEYSNGMLRSLRAIETGIDALTSVLAQQLGLSGGAFDSSGLGLGSNTSGGGLLGGLFGIGGLLGGIGKALFGTTTTKTLVDQGVQFYSATLGAIMAGGVQGASYQLVEIVKKKKFFGISTGTSTSYSTVTNALDSAVQDQAGLILTSIYSSIVDAAQTIGISGVEDLLKSFTVNLGKLSLDGLKGDEIKDAISAVFSKAADDMAAYAVPGIAAFQKVGEGLFETLTRLAKDYTTLDVQLQSIGRTFGAVGVSSLDAREALIDLFGSLDNFVDQTSFYREHFLTEAQQIAPVITAVGEEMARLGLSGVTTIAQFKGVIDGLDLTTDAGRQMYAALMAVAQGFYAIDQYQSQTASKRADLEIELMQAQGDAAGALAAKRAAELAAMDESLRGLQSEVYLYEDIATAKDALTAAYNREHDALTTTISKFSDFSKSLRDFRDSLFTDGTSGTSYTAALAKLISTGSMAAAGDETALGGLQGVSTDFLAVAKDNARSLTDYRRAVALVAGYVGGALDASNAQVDYAQAQLDALDASVTGLIDINDSVISVHDAIVDLERLLAQANPGLGFTEGPGMQPVVAVPLGDAMVPAGSLDDSGSTVADLAAGLDDINAGLRAIKVDTGKSARLAERWDGDGIPVRNNPAGDALVTEAA